MRTSLFGNHFLPMGSSSMSTVVESKTTLVALQGLRSANADINKSAERLATGLRINKAGDDPAGFGKAAALKAEIGSYVQVKKNINSAVNDLDKVGSALTSMTDYLVEMRSIALAATSETDDGIKDAYQESFSQLRTGINEIAANTKFGDDAVLSAATTSKTVQTGILEGSVKTMSFTAVTATALSINSIDVSNIASGDMGKIDDAIDLLSETLAKVGGYQKSLESSLELADANILAKTGQYRDIMDADLAAEATNLAAARIRQDASTAVLAQANSMNRTITDYLLNGALA
jgi:flagellin